MNKILKFTMHLFYPECEYEKSFARSKRIRNIGFFIKPEISEIYMVEILDNEF